MQEREAEQQTNDGELILEEVDVQSEVELDGWGEPIVRSTENTWDPTGYSDKAYRPPHARELEERTAQSAAGW